MSSVIIEKMFMPQLVIYRFVNMWSLMWNMICVQKAHILAGGHLTEDACLLWLVVLYHCAICMHLLINSNDLKILTAIVRNTYCSWGINSWEGVYCCFSRVWFFAWRTCVVDWESLMLEKLWCLVAWWETCWFAFWVGWLLPSWVDPAVWMIDAGSNIAICFHVDDLLIDSNDPIAKPIVG